MVKNFKKIQKKEEKRVLNHIRVLLWKNPLEKTRNIPEMRRFWKSAIMQRPLQNSQFGSKYKILKNMRKNDSLIILELFCGKNRLRKQQMFEKWDGFENTRSCKGYSLCKIVSLGQKLKFIKTCEKRFFNHIRVVLCKSRLKKHQIFEKWDHFENRPSCKDYSLCKRVSLGPKLKLKKICEKRFFNHIRVVLGKKRLEETPNIREMRRSWKSGIMQRLQLLQNSQFGSKMKIQKNMRKTIL